MANLQRIAHARYQEALNFAELTEPAILYADLVKTVDFKEAILFGYSTVSQIQNIGKPVILPADYVKGQADKIVVSHAAECLRPEDSFCKAWNECIDDLFTYVPTAAKIVARKARNGFTAVACRVTKEVYKLVVGNTLRAGTMNRCGNSKRELEAMYGKKLGALTFVFIMVPYEDIAIVQEENFQILPSGASHREPLLAKVTFDSNFGRLVGSSTITVPMDYVCIDHTSQLKVMRLLKGDSAQEQDI